MKNTLVKSCFIFILFFFTQLLSCQKPDYNSLNLYQGDKLVLNGYVDSDSGCIVNITKTGTTSGDVLFKQLMVKDARVFLFENGDSVLELIQDSIGYFSGHNFKPKVGKIYKVKATSLSLQTCESEEEILNDFYISPKSLASRKDNLIRGFSGILFSYVLNFDNSIINYFEFNSDLDNFSSATYITQPIGISETCGYSNYFTTSLVPTICLIPNDTIKIGVLFNIDVPIKPTSKIKLSTSSVSPIYYKYLSTLNQPHHNASAAFFEPNTLVTNIKGGYGIFYTRNTKSYTYKL